MRFSIQKSISNRSLFHNYLFAFLLGFGALLIVYLPAMCLEHGYFLYYGDYNSQQLPFYSLANDAVRSGSFGWNWYTDLGANFIGSYAFYLLGSPFFWITTILPRSWMLYALPVLLSMKHGIAAVTAYAYIQRFVRSRNAALIGGLLYAFSGFQLFNLFFNHFQDVTAFFPLLLIAMEESINQNRKGVFALAVALMGCINYFFFTGQAVFLVLYFIVRCFSKDFHATPKKFFRLALEAIIGVLLACFLLLPSALAILANNRITSRLYGMDMLAYNDRTRIWRIIESFFLIPDVPARPNLFSSNDAKWASIGGYLPLFSMTGVLSFCKYKEGHWAKRLVLLCTICAFVPILNSCFYALNGSYYARWFYMPIWHHGTDDCIRSGQHHDFCKIRFGHFCPDDGSFRRDFDSADKEQRQGDMGKICRISAAFLFGSGHLYTFSGGNCFSVPPPACWKAHPCNGTANDRSSLHILHDDRCLFWCIHTTAGRRIY